MSYLLTSKQVSSGHPDKVCDQISDAILDFCLHIDKDSRVACETFGKNFTIIVEGEISSRGYNELISELKNIVYETLVEIGINPEDAEKYQVINYLKKQSNDIGLGVDVGSHVIISGYATNETKSYMPLAFVLATEALQRLRILNNPKLKPDAKSEVILKYNENETKIQTFVISVQHDESLNQDDVIAIVEPIMKNIAKEHGLNTDFKALINPTGKFVTGGFHRGVGLTGRKVMADTYGGCAHHGGCILSGKDPSEIGRSGAYVARWIAKNIVASDYADKCEVELSYAVDVIQPISIHIETFGTGKVDLDKLKNNILEEYDLSQRGIIELFDLLKPIYLKSASYGHFGRPNFAWEKIGWNVVVN